MPTFPIKELYSSSTWVGHEDSESDSDFEIDLNISDAEAQELFKETNSIDFATVSPTSPQLYIYPR